MALISAAGAYGHIIRDRDFLAFPELIGLGAILWISHHQPCSFDKRFL